MPASPLVRRSSDKAAALIIVLAFVVLLTGLALAYFSSTTTDRQLAHSSYNDTSSDLLARSALDIVVGGFKQEIADGSNPQVVDGTTIYIPKTTLQRVVLPKRGGHPNPTPADETTDPIPNLIRRSIRNDSPTPAPGVPSLASAVNSAPLDPANPKRGDVTRARWNTHYLLPKLNTGDDSTEPTAAFTAPDWVFVTGQGPTVLAAPSSSVVGRYAYAVYDEGGLLDINVAGYPTSTDPTIPSVTDIGRKGVLAFADLTALPTTPGNFLSQTAINKFILFRNYATMAGSGALDLSITPAQATAFVNYYLGGSTQITQIGTSQNFGQVNAVSSNASGAPRTDQSFITRAELINFVKSTDIPFTGIVNTLQYLGTFSREQNKPNFQLTTTPFGFTRRVLPQRFYLGNLNEVVNPPTDPANIRTHFGLQFASVGNAGSGPCDNQVRWKYVGQDANPAATPRPDISPFPSDLTTLDFFQYIHYALFGLTTADSDPLRFPSTLQIGASIIDQYDNDLLTTGIYFNPGSNPDNCDPSISACITFGADAGSAPPAPLPCVTPNPPPAYTSSGVFLNRPFRSVGEFGYAYNLYDAILHRNGPTYYLTDFREPYKTTNLDPALLDFFTYNKASVRSGIVSLNTRQPRVLASLLKGAIYNNASSSVVNNSDAITAANSIVKTNYATTTYAFSRADITNLLKAVAVTNAPFTNDDATTSEARETIARALSEVVQTRTWGLLIDLVAQTGHYKPNATSLTNDFIVEGEKRYWLHIAIDRFDGTIVGQQLEEVTE